MLRGKQLQAVTTWRSGFTCFICVGIFQHLMRPPYLKSRDSVAGIEQDFLQAIKINSLNTMIVSPNHCRSGCQRI